MSLNKFFIKLKGGLGSGNHGHAGIPGKHGGSAPKGGGGSLGLSVSADKIEKVAKDVYSEVGLPENCNTSGYCQIIAIRTWDQLGQPKDLVPYDVEVEGKPHTILYNKDKRVVVDVAGDQFSPDKKQISIGPEEKYNYKNGYPTSEDEMDDLRADFGF